MDVRSVALCELNLTLARLRQLPDASVREKAESLRRKGQLSPLVAADQDGTLVLVDGFIRHQAALRLGLDSLLVDIVRLPSAQMKAQVYLRNRERGLLLLEECRLVQELCDLDGLNQVEVADLLERHKSWVCRRLAIFRSLSTYLLAHEAIGFLTGGSIRRLAQLQARNQEEVMASVQRDGIAYPDVGALCDLFRRAPDPIARRYVLEHPQEALIRARRPTEAKADPRLSLAAQELLKEILTLRQVSLRIQRRAQEGIALLPPDSVESMGKAIDAAEHDCHTALSIIRHCLPAT